MSSCLHCLNFDLYRLVLRIGISEGQSNSAFMLPEKAYQIEREKISTVLEEKWKTLWKTL
jgi:hypothetical protein